MTSPLPTPSKPTPAEGARPDMGNFFQFLSPAKGSDSSKPDFESFLKQKTPDDEIQEERAAAKNRKKPVDAAAVASPAWEIPSADAEKQPIARTSTSPESDAAPQASVTDLSRPTDESADPSHSQSPTESTNPSENSPESQSEPAVSETVSESPTEISEDPLPESAKNEDPAGESLKEPESEPADANGMETASTDPEMISLETFDGVESGAAASREPSITSIHRLTAFAAPDRNGLAPIGASGNSAESGLGHLATGQNAPVDARTSTPASPAAQASALFKSLAPELEKFRQTGRNQMQLDIPVGENESVRIRLSVRAGELRSTFITESPELREALQKAWPEFAQLSRDRGVRLGDPSFQQGFQDSNSTFDQNTRRDRSSSESDSISFPGSTASRKPAPTRPVSSRSSTALWA
ncbi:MAG: hypothetical protein ACKOAS_07860 [Verrucomicrobiota bacterium]